MHLHHVDTHDSLSLYSSLTLYSSSRHCVANAIAEESSRYHSTRDQSDTGAGNQQHDQTQGSDHSRPIETEGPDTGQDELDERISQAEAIRLAMALIEGAQYASEDRTAKAEKLCERIRLIGGQAPSSDDETNETLGNRLRSLSRTRDRNLAEQLQLQVRFDDAEHYKLDGCRSMIVWMDVHLGIAKTNASEQLRVGRALQELPILESLFTLGQISFSQLREVTRVATSQTDAEFALATLALSVTETREYCLRFRHDTDRDEDARLAAQHGQDISDAHAALRAYERRTLSFSEPDAHSTRIVIELPRELGEEFRRSLEQCEDWIREGGDDLPQDISHLSHRDADNITSQQQLHNTDFVAEKVDAGATIRPTATQLRADAALLMSRQSLANAGQPVAMADRYRVHVNLDLRQLIESFDDEQSSKSATAENSNCCTGGNHETRATDSEQESITERPWLHGAGPVSRATAQRLAEIAGFTLVLRDDEGEVLATADKAPPFTRRQLRTLRARDRRCQMPGCGSTRHAEGHHVVHRENGGQSTMDNAVHLCGACHRLLHEGGFRLERIGPNGADMGQQAAQVHAADNASQARAQAKVARIRRYRLYGADGREYASVNAARANMNVGATSDRKHRAERARKAHQTQQPQQPQQPQQTSDTRDSTKTTNTREYTYAHTHAPIPQKSSAPHSRTDAIV